jgi:hypothetical protein
MVIGWPTKASRHSTIAQEHGKSKNEKKSN